MKSQLLSIDRITVPEWADRPFSKVADDRDFRSIEQRGIQQPLVVLEDGAKFVLVKGLRRLRIAKRLGLGKVPIVTAAVPDGRGVDDYGRELRLALSEHRADLLPSQKCSLVETLKERFQMNNKTVANYLSIDQDSVTNWLAVRNYVPEIVQALDSDRLTMQAARVFDGMTEKGQRALWKRHEDELTGRDKADAHKRLRKLYPPSERPDYYRQPALVAKRLARKQGKRRGKEQPTITANEKRRLMSSVEMKELELHEGTDEEKRLKAEIQAATVPIYAIMRSEKLRAMLPAEMSEEFERFMEIF